MKKLFFFFLLPIGLFSLEKKPWFHNTWEFQFYPGYSYSYYPSVDNGTNPSSYSSHNQLLKLGLGVAVLPKLDVEYEMEFAKTRKLVFGGRSVAVQCRYQFLDDISGDFVSFCMGGNIRYVPPRNLSDVSSPYHSNWNAEIVSSMGREWARSYYWCFRMFGFASFGFANHGYPWIRALFSMAANFHDKHRFELYSDGYFGLGNETTVNIDHFRSYQDIAHRSVDIGISYRRNFDMWGILSLSYEFRPYAESYPIYESILTASYRLPFSIF